MKNVNTVGPMVHICFGALGIIVMNTFPQLFFFNGDSGCCTRLCSIPNDRNLFIYYLRNIKSDIGTTCSERSGCFNIKAHLIVWSHLISLPSWGVYFQVLLITVWKRRYMVLFRDCLYHSLFMIPTLAIRVV